MLLLRIGPEPSSTLTTSRFLYAGNVVDTTLNCGAFIRDRQERFDRYCAAHGEHWMWYEPPLKLHPETRPTMSGSLALSQFDGFTNLGPWYLMQGFWKRSGRVNRIASRTGSRPAAHVAFSKLPDGRVFCQDAGPKQAFRSMIDSGATYPSLHTEDLQKLMIDKQNYATQNAQVLSMANGFT